MNARRRAFTLMEIILVVVIIGILAALVMPRLVGQTDKAKVNAAKTQIAILKAALSRFEADVQRFPSTAEGLQALTDRPASLPRDAAWERYLEDDIPDDPWGHPYIYRFPGVVNTDGHDLFSAGPDAKEGTEDDIGNTK
jgi:general secretion pathway protein G